jgi:hypothetical protein
MTWAGFGDFLIGGALYLCLERVAEVDLYVWVLYHVCCDMLCLILEVMTDVQPNWTPIYLD